MKHHPSVRKSSPLGRIGVCLVRAPSTSDGQSPWSVQLHEQLQRLKDLIGRAQAFSIALWAHYSVHIGLVLMVGLLYLALNQSRSAPAWLLQPIQFPEIPQDKPASPEVLQALLRRSAHLGRNSPE